MLVGQVGNNVDRYGVVCSEIQQADRQSAAHQHPPHKAPGYLCQASGIWLGYGGKPLPLLPSRPCGFAAAHCTEPKN